MSATVKTEIFIAAIGLLVFALDLGMHHKDLAMAGAGIALLGVYAAFLDRK